MDGAASTNQRTERVAFETERHLVVGNMTLPQEGYQRRLSDVINRPEVAFIPLVDVEIAPREGGDVTKHDFILLAKASIELVHPVADGD